MGSGDRHHRGVVRKWVNANTIGAAFLLGALGVSLARVMSIQHELFDPDKTIVRIAHWQLELGYREAMQSIIEEYEKLHPGVEVIQMPVTERVYGQWLNTHLVSGTAPDLAEIGFAKLAIDDQYLARFFMPLTELIELPNPYNAGTELADRPWRETFIDGMRGGYRESFQDYFSAPTNIHTVRLFYNKQMLREATGRDGPPETFGQLLKACGAIRALGRRSGRKLIPIAGSKYSSGIFLWRYEIPFTAGFEARLDENLDGSISPNESYVGYVRGLVNMQTPAVRASYECLRALCEQFPVGFMAMGREQAAFLFVQAKAAMIATGSWDARSLFAQAKFDVGIIDFPLPGRGERWGRYIAGRVNEAGTTGGGRFGVYKYSAQRDQAIDFLRFLTSRKYNELFNLKAGWVPVIIGARTAEPMRPFIPQPLGFNSSVNFAYGNYAATILNGQLWRYLQGEITYDQFAGKVDQALTNPGYGGDRAWAIEYDTKRRWCRNQERVLALQSTRMLMDPEAADAAPKFRRALVQQVRANNGEELRCRFERLRGRPIEEL